MFLKVSKIQDLLDELKCSQCKSILSFLPIYHCSAVGNVCGRCAPNMDWMISNGTLERATAYESVAKYMLFPCINKNNGCNAELRWNQVEEHEKNCNTSIFNCPLPLSLVDNLSDCGWKGNVNDLASHLLTSHKSAVQTLPVNFEMDIKRDNVQIIPVSLNDQMFIILTNFDKTSDKFYCVAMCCNKEPENTFYRYQLQMGHQNDYFLALRKSNTEPFEDTTKALNNLDSMISIDTISVSNLLGGSNFAIFCKISITKKNKNEISAIMKELNLTLPVEEVKTMTVNSDIFNIISNTNIGTLTKVAPAPAKKPTVKPVPLSTSQKAPQKGKPNGNGTNSVPDKSKATKQLSALDRELLEELECPICRQHMTPPIYICPTGHSLCKECKEKMQICGFCQVRISDTRNFTLEKLTTRVNYPCKFAEFGCQEILNSQHIDQHEVSCMFGNNKCPLKMLRSMCTIKAAPVDIIQHIRENHVNNLMNMNFIHFRNIKATNTTTYDVVILDNEVFLFCCKHSLTTGPIKFNIVHMGNKTSQPRFAYELDFIDQTGKGMRFIITQLSYPLCANISAALKNCLTIPLELLTPFITIKKGSPSLVFKFRIRRL